MFCIIHLILELFVWNSNRRAYTVVCSSLIHRGQGKHLGHSCHHLLCPTSDSQQLQLRAPYITGMPQPSSETFIFFYRYFLTLPIRVFKCVNVCSSVGFYLTFQLFASVAAKCLCISFRWLMLSLWKIIKFTHGMQAACIRKQWPLHS